MNVHCKAVLSMVSKVKNHVMTVVCVAGTVILLTVAAPTIPRFLPDLQENRVSPESTEESFLQESLTSEDGFELSDGRWLFPGMVWTISRSGPRPLPPVSDIKEINDIPSEPVELDQHLMAIIRSMMSPDLKCGDLQRYQLSSPELKALAWSIQTPELEIPVQLQVWWPAGDGLWTEVMALRETDDSVHDCELTLPDDFQLVATRIGSDGRVQCYLVSLPNESAQITDRFEGHGWTVHAPAAATGISDLFWISSGADRFEVCIRRTPNKVKCTAMIRRIDVFNTNHALTTSSGV
ncbi:MAG: hypothetical protein R3C11_29965 [Planctomycetaceae bacterium]